MPEQLFHTTDEHFSFEANGVTIACQRLIIPSYVAFHVTFSSQRKPITVARAKGVAVPYFWTSIPEGRQSEAEGVGKLIEQYLLKQK
ncbi:MAG TPA: hypothetical protein VJU78_09960 [Chitinophagaceae bacterium]|nr:hypothetical protein [Chitinophagaceae bacterium]